MNSDLLPPPPPPEYTQSLEDLPKYTSSLNYYGLSLIKTEFITPYQYNNGNRSWKPVLLELNSTQLKIYNLNVDKKLQDLLICLYFELNCLDQLTKDINSHYKKSKGFDYSELSSNDTDDISDLFSGDAYGGNDSSKLSLNDSKLGKLKNKFKNQKSSKTLQSIKSYYDDLLKDNKFFFEPTSLTKEYNQFAKKYRGNLMHCYSLANLQVGEAPSLNQIISAIYKEEHNGNTNNSSLVKYKNTLRLRIEYKQILLQFWSFFGMISWFRNFTIGRDLSVPVEARHVSRLKSIPSRNTSRNNALLAATAAAANYGRNRDRDRDRDNSPVDGVDEDLSMFHSNYLTIKGQDNNSHSDTSSENSSVFDNERRGSIVSTTTSIEPIDHVTINNYKFYSQEYTFTTAEKQYISNCIPDLNSFDKWNGKLITISNVGHFVKDKRSFEDKDDVFISYAALGNLVQSYDRKSHDDSSMITTQTFVIHQKGLVGLGTQI